MTIDLFQWGNPIEVERRRRIQLTLWAYAYEIADAPLVIDGRFDTECRQSDLSINTGHLDDWWRTCFNPSTGMWIHMHPELDKVRKMYDRNTSSTIG